MPFFDPRKYAARIQRAYPAVRVMTVSVVDNDLHLVIQIHVGDWDDGDLIGEYDTGLDGTAWSPETEQLADRLVKELLALGIEASKHVWTVTEEEELCSES